MASNWRRLLALLVFAAGQTAGAQTESGVAADGSGWGTMPMEARDEISAEQRDEIQARIDVNIAQLRAQRRLPATPQPAPPPAVSTLSLQWPLRLAAGFSELGYYGFSNFVDHDPAYPGRVLDWNCGSRTYDLASGYNHQGTDIFITPFPWAKMDADEVEIVAAADGVIVNKQDGNFDRNCGFNNLPFNGVFVRHADGSVVWYLHMKKGSLLSKGIGDSVTVGERLGRVGSSGSSSGPHLHIEVHDPGGALLDPYAGPCNDFNADSLWAAQPPYADPAILKLTTGTGTPDFGVCPADEDPKEATQFRPGQMVYFTDYYRDVEPSGPGQVAHSTVRRPDGSVYASFGFTWSIYAANAYSYHFFTSFAPAGPTGTWQYEVVYNGRLSQIAFDVVAAPVSTATPTNTPAASPTPALGSCVGDCDGGGDVTINDLTILVNIALGNAQPVTCLNGVPAATPVDVILIIQAVKNALTACPEALAIG